MASSNSLYRKLQAAQARGQLPPDALLDKISQHKGNYALIPLESIYGVIVVQGVPYSVLEQHLTVFAAPDRVNGSDFHLTMTLQSEDGKRHQLRVFYTQEGSRLGPYKLCPTEEKSEGARKLIIPTQDPILLAMLEAQFLPLVRDLLRQDREATDAMKMQYLQSVNALTDKLKALLETEEAHQDVSTVLTPLLREAEELQLSADRIQQIEPHFTDTRRKQLLRTIKRHMTPSPPPHKHPSALPSHNSYALLATTMPAADASCLPRDEKVKTKGNKTRRNRTRRNKIPSKQGGSPLVQQNTAVDSPADFNEQISHVDSKWSIEDSLEQLVRTMDSLVALRSEVNAAAVINDAPDDACLFDALDQRIQGVMVAVLEAIIPALEVGGFKTRNQVYSYLGFTHESLQVAIVEQAARCDDSDLLSALLPHLAVDLNQISMEHGDHHLPLLLYCHRHHKHQVLAVLLRQCPRLNLFIPVENGFPWFHTVFTDFNDPCQPLVTQFIEHRDGLKRYLAQIEHLLKARLEKETQTHGVNSQEAIFWEGQWRKYQRCKKMIDQIGQHGLHVSSAFAAIKKFFQGNECLPERARQALFASSHLEAKRQALISCFLDEFATLSPEATAKILRKWEIRREPPTAMASVTVDNMPSSEEVSRLVSNATALIPLLFARVRVTDVPGMRSAHGGPVRLTQEQKRTIGDIDKQIRALRAEMSGGNGDSTVAGRASAAMFGLTGGSAPRGERCSELAPSSPRNGGSG